MLEINIIVLLNVLFFESDVMEICSEKFAIGYDSFFEIEICRPHDHAKLQQFDAIPSDILTRCGLNYCVFLAGDFNSDILVSNNYEVITVNILLSHSFVPFN